MNFLSSFPESLTTLKTNFAVSEQVSPSHTQESAHTPPVDAPQLASHSLGLESALYLSAFRICVSIALDRGERAAGEGGGICHL